MSLKLVVFDVDGTLVDSQADILASMQAAFAAIDRPAPTRADVLGIVGLSLPQAMATLAPDADIERMTAIYKERYAALRVQNGADGSPLYPGIRGLLDRLNAHDDMLLGVATGKSRRGLNGLLDAHGLHGHFVTTQCADDHPSKPHPSMLLQAMRDGGVDAHQCVMIGDTSFDIDMARAAGMASIGVNWGYHPRARLAEASLVVDTVDALEEVIPAALGDIT